MQATFAVTFAVTVVFLLVCTTYISFHLHFSTFGKNTLQKHYDGMITRDSHHHTESDSESTTTSETSGRWHDADAPTPGRMSPPSSLITRLLDPSLPRDMDGGGRTQQTITEDEAMYVWPAATAKLHLCLFRWLTTSTADRFLLQKRLVVRQYKYVLYLQQMTYVLVLVLFCKYMCTARLPGPLLRAVPA